MLLNQNKRAWSWLSCSPQQGAGENKNQQARTCLRHLFAKQVAGGSYPFQKSLKNNLFPHTIAFPSPEAEVVVQFAGGLETGVAGHAAP